MLALATNFVKAKRCLTWNCNNEDFSVVRRGNSSKNCLFLTFSRFWRETQSVSISRYQTLWSKMLHSHSSQLWLDSLELWSLITSFSRRNFKKFRRFYDDTAQNCMKLHEKWTVSEMWILISKILGFCSRFFKTENSFVIVSINWDASMKNRACVWLGSLIWLVEPAIHTPWPVSSMHSLRVDQFPTRAPSLGCRAGFSTLVQPSQAGPTWKLHLKYYRGGYDRKLIYSMTVLICDLFWVEWAWACVRACECLMIVRILMLSIRRSCFLAPICTNFVVLWKHNVKNYILIKIFFSFKISFRFTHQHMNSKPSFV